MRVFFSDIRYTQRGNCNQSIWTPANSHPRTGPNTSFPILGFRPTARRSAKQILANHSLFSIPKAEKMSGPPSWLCTPTSKPISCQNSACTVYAYFILKGNTKWNKSVVTAQDFGCLTGSSSSDNARTVAATACKYDVLGGLIAKRVPESLNKTWRGFEQKMSKKITMLTYVCMWVCSSNEKTNQKSWLVIWMRYGYWTW